MAATPLYDTLIEAGARMGDYAGVETPSVFTDVSREFRELSSGCAMYDLGWGAKHRGRRAQTSEGRATRRRSEPAGDFCFAAEAGAGGLGFGGSAAAA